MSPVADIADRRNSKMADVVHGSRDYFSADTDICLESFKSREKSENYDCTLDAVTLTEIEKKLQPELNEILVDLCIKNDPRYKEIGDKLILQSGRNGALEGQPDLERLTDADVIEPEGFDCVTKVVFDDINFKSADGVAGMDDASDDIVKDLPKVKERGDRLKGGNNVKVHIPSDHEVAFTAKEGLIVHSADTEFSCDPWYYYHYNVDVVKERPMKLVVENDLALLPFAPQPPILCQQAINHQRKKHYLFEFMFLVVLGIITVTPEVIKVSFQIMAGVAIGKFAPKWCGLHGEQKTAHGRSANSGVEHGDTNQASGRQRTIPPLRGGPGDGSGDGTDGDRDKEPPRPGPSDQIDNIQHPRLRHGDIKDIYDEVQVVLASNDETESGKTKKILQEMNQCLNCCKLHDEENCPSKFCSRLTSSIEHFLRRTCCRGDCTACGLVKRLVQFHLRDQAENDKKHVVVTDDSILAFLLEWFPHFNFDLDLDETESTVAAEPKYLGKNKGAKLADIAEDPLRMLAGFDGEHNEVAIGGFLQDTFGVGDRESRIAGDVHLADDSTGSVDVEAIGGLGGVTSALGAISEEMEAMSISSETESALDTRTSSIGTRGPPGDSLARSSLSIVRNQPLDEPAAVTADYFTDPEQCLYRFYEDEARPSSKPAPRETRQPTSLPAFVKRKKVVPVRPGHIGIGGTVDLDRTCHVWERLILVSGSRQWCRGVERDAEGVFLNNDFVEEHSITVDGRYDEDIHWRKLDLIGEGCFGKVFHCQDETTKALFCIKQIPLEKLEVSEIKIWGRLDHAGFCNLHGAVRVGQNVLIFMPYVGDTLREFLEDQELTKLPRCLAQRLELQPALSYLRQILEALYYMEQKGIIHNDLKSANILIDENFMLKIIDFGLAHQIQPGKKFQVLRAIGTPVICSPERMRSEPYDYTADVWSCMGIFRELLTGHFMWFPEFSEAKFLTLIFKIGDLKAPPMDLVPDALGLPERVLDLFRFGWDIDASTRYHAADLLKLVNGICTDLEKGTLTYETVPLENLPLDPLEEAEEDEWVPPSLAAMSPHDVLTSFAIPAPKRNVADESDIHGLNFVDSEDRAVTGRNVLDRLLLPKIDVHNASLESNQDKSADGNVPRFLHGDANSSNQMVINSLSQSVDPATNLNLPALSLLDKTHSSDSFSVPVTIFNQRSPKSSDLGSSTLQSMDYEIHMQSVTTSGIDPGFHRTSQSSYCPTSEMTDSSVCTIRGSILTEAAISRSDHSDDTDGQMVLSADTSGAVAAPKLPQSPDDQGMPLDQRSKASSSSSDEILEKLRQELELDHQRRSFDTLDSNRIVEYASSVEAISPSTPTESGFSNRSSVSVASEVRRKISEEGGLRFLEKVHETRQRSAGPSPVPVVVFHQDSIDGDVIVSFSCSTGYRRQHIKEVIDTVASRLHQVYPKFTVRDREGNTLCLDETIDKIRSPGMSEIHLLVYAADPERDTWYIDDHEVHKNTVY